VSHFQTQLARVAQLLQANVVPTIAAILFHGGIILAAKHDMWMLEDVLATPLALSPIVFLRTRRDHPAVSRLAFWIMIVWIIRILPWSDGPLAAGKALLIAAPVAPLWWAYYLINAVIFLPIGLGHLFLAIIQ
jgi:hypothetical protein